MGGPGSGKSLQAGLIKACNHISIGALLRRIIKDPYHPKAQYFNSLMQQGKLIPDEEVLQILKKALDLQNDRYFLLDGFPRTQEQWQSHKNLFGTPVGIVNFQLSRELMYQRLLARKRTDDTSAIAQIRLDEYYNKIAPLALSIIKECHSRAYTIDASQNIDEVHMAFINALNNLTNNTFSVDVTYQPKL